mgnify:FL=1
MEENKEIKKSKKIMTFDEWLELVRKYKEQYGNLLVPSKYITPTGENLGRWIVNCRAAFKKGKLSLEQREALDKIGMTWQMVERNDWKDMFALASLYKEEHGNLIVPFSYITPNGKPLGRWIRQQRTNYQQKKLSEKQIEKLESIGMLWHARKDDWEEMYSLATDYYKEHGNLNVPKDYVTPEGEPLGHWIKNQRLYYCYKRTITEEQIEKLNSIGMLWKVNQDYSWNHMYNLSKKYFEKHGNLLITRSYVAENGEHLGKWIATRRCEYMAGTLSKEKQEKLEDIGMVWQVNQSYSWSHMYKLAADYFEKYGNLTIPTSYVTENGENLGAWIAENRDNYKIKNLSEDQVEKLETIGMAWSLAENEWNEKYEMVKEYYLKYGNLSTRRNSNPPLSPNLLNWLSWQRKYYQMNMLSESKTKKLESIGMNWDVSGKHWYDMYKLAREYRLKYGNLLISKEYITEDNKNLGMWIFIQRNSYVRGMLPDDKKKMLDALGIIWDIKTNKTEIDIFIEELPFYVDKTINSDILSHTSLMEFQTKMQFLNDIDISPVDEEGKLVDIFSMSNYDIEEKYGVNIESLIKYYKRDFSRKLHL